MPGAITKKIYPNGRKTRAETEPFPSDDPRVPERIWEQWPTESAQAYHAFEHYLKRPSFTGSYEEHMADPGSKGSRSTWLVWTKRWRWVERREAYRRFLADGVHLKASISLSDAIDVVVSNLKDFGTSPADVARLTDSLTKIVVGTKPTVPQGPTGDVIVELDFGSGDSETNADIQIQEA